MVARERKEKAAKRAWKQLKRAQDHALAEQTAQAAQSAANSFSLKIHALKAWIFTF